MKLTYPLIRTKSLKSQDSFIKVHCSISRFNYEGKMSNIDLDYSSTTIDNPKGGAAVLLLQLMLAALATVVWFGIPIAVVGSNTSLCHRGSVLLGVVASA